MYFKTKIIWCSTFYLKKIVGKSQKGIPPRMKQFSHFIKKLTIKSSQKIFLFFVEQKFSLKQKVPERFLNGRFPPFSS